ncbi:MAG: hypothetical protein ACKOWF_02935 [Chloroflexota bacterium]
MAGGRNRIRGSAACRRDLLANRPPELALAQPDLPENRDPIGEERPPLASSLFGRSAGVVADLAAGRS